MGFCAKNEQNESIQFGSTTINFKILYGQRKNLRLSVNPDQKIVVDAPEEKELAEIIKFIKKRASWIIKQKDYFERFQPVQPPRKYLNGETHQYLGKQYRLKIISSKPESVKLKGGYFYVFTDTPQDTGKIKELLDFWYHEHAKKLFKDRLKSCYEIIKYKGIPFPKELVIKKMQKRWGSCLPSERIILNIELIKTPVSCIDCVIIHELCHLKYPNHNKDFYKLLEIIVPDWKQRKERLELALI